MRTSALGLIAGLLFAATGAWLLLPVNAAPTPATERISSSGSELLVFESEHCTYCFIFRRDVAPGYLQSPRAREVPLRYIDVSDNDISKMRLKAPVTIVPTFVLIRDGQEVDRINGYMGPEPFYHMISRLMR